MKEAKIIYKQKEDTFELWANPDGKEWGLVLSCECVSAAEEPGKTDFIHYHMMVKILELIAYGYKINPAIKNN